MLETKSIITIIFILMFYSTVIVAADNHHPHLRRSRDFLPNSEELTTEHWVGKAQNLISQKLEIHSNQKIKRAKNVIFFVGDGMSVHTVTAARAFLGDISEQLYFEKFPYLGFAKTYAVDKRVPDAAATSTAYLSGVKANYGTIGVNAQVKRQDCYSAINETTHTESIVKWAQDAGKWTGLVTTARVTDAATAGVYAHVADRDWENDADVKRAGCSAEQNFDIARQLVEGTVGQQLRVILGGGRRNFRDVQTRDEEGRPGARNDKRDLIKDWLAAKKLNVQRAEYVWSRRGLQLALLNKVDHLLGLFSDSNCPYHGDLERNHLQNADPSLSEMTEAALNILQRSDNGYFLFVESANIDSAHHANQARKALEDTVEFSKAVELARNLTNEEDTLIVVTSDHSHTMTINGYPFRHQNILGLSDANTDDNLPYTILSYANGPGYWQTYDDKSGRLNLLKTANFNDPEQQYMATVPLEKGAHGGEDVAVYASGPYEHYFAGNYEQSNIPAIIANAANFGPFSDEAMDNE